MVNTFKDENREYVNYDDIPARVIEGLVAIEDTQFFEHFGVNPDAISRAVIKIFNQVDIAKELVLLLSNL